MQILVNKKTLLTQLNGNASRSVSVTDKKNYDNSWPQTDAEEIGPLCINHVIQLLTKYNDRRTWHSAIPIWPDFDWPANFSCCWTASVTLDQINSDLQHALLSVK